MLCSACSGSVRPIVAWDIDGTIADYHSHLTNFCIEYWNLPYPGYNASPWDGEGDFEDWLGITQEEYREAKLAFRQGGMKRTMPIYPGVKHALREFRVDAELWLCTTRPWQRLDNVDPDTRFWLDRHDIEYDGLLYGEDKYGDLIKRVDKDRIVAVVDDLPEMFDRAKELDLPVLQRYNSHNQYVSERRSPGGTLGMARAWTLHQIESWKDRNGKEYR